MKKIPLFLTALFPALAIAAPELPPQAIREISLANIQTEIEPQINVAKPEKRAQNLPHLAAGNVQPIRVSFAQLKQNPRLTHQLLTQAIYARNEEMIEKLLQIYRTFPQRDPIMEKFAEGKLAALRENFNAAIDAYRNILAQNPNLNPVRLELAIALFAQKQDDAAKAQFEKAQTAADLPPQARALIAAYLEALQARDSWNVEVAFNYLRDTNVNNMGDGGQIRLDDNLSWTTPASMKPQHAHGLAYSLDISRDFNLWGSNYLAVGNELWGKNYWDNHDYDDISSRTFIGYTHKTAKQTFKLKPFYEKRWYGGESYRWGNGVRMEFSRWLNPNWQLSTATEFSKLRYFDATSQNGNNKLLSATLVWARTPKQFFYIGSDFIAERTASRAYSNDSKSLRLGWGQEWSWGVSSRLGLSLMKRDYKEGLMLGRVLFPFVGEKTLSLKRRQDKIYGINLTLWKRDWHVLGITPKLQFTWRKQDSNIPEMYSYTQKNVNLVFEKSF